MRYRLRIEVSLKSGHSDPEGETTARLLKELGYKGYLFGASTYNTDNMVKLGKNSQITELSFGKNRKLKGCTEFWKTNSVTFLKKRTDEKGLPEKPSSLF